MSVIQLGLNLEGSIVEPAAPPSDMEETIESVMKFLETAVVGTQDSSEAENAVTRREQRRSAYLEARRQVEIYSGQSQRELDRRNQKLRKTWDAFLKSDSWCKIFGYLPFRSESERRRIMLDQSLQEYDRHQIGPSYQGVEYRQESKPIVFGPKTIGGPPKPIIYLRVYSPITQIVT